MLIDVLTLNADGTQTVEQREVADETGTPPEEPDYMAFLAGLVEGLTDE